jgi:hypothetical protein
MTAAAGYTQHLFPVSRPPPEQAFEAEAAPMVEAFLIARRLRWSDTVDDDCLEAGVAIGVGGVVKELLTAS